QRGGIDRVPARRDVVRYRLRQDRRRLAPQRRQVQPLAGQPDDAIPRSLQCVPAHTRILPEPHTPQIPHFWNGPRPTPPLPSTRNRPMQDGAAMGDPTVTQDARTPEELETMLEDALLLRDPDTHAALFEDAALLVAGHASPARGSDVVRLALATWQGDHSYVADPRAVLQTRDLALVVAKGGTNVARRTGGAWRYAIVLQST